MIKRIQTCERDGRERELKDDENPEFGGWREVPVTAGRTKTLCPHCIHALDAWIEKGPEVNDAAESVRPQEA